MQRILLVKTSSLGDVVHNLPVASDIAAAYPDAEIDWVVEENFAAIPRLHPAVRRVISVGARRWRKTWSHASTLREIRSFLHVLRAVRYDAVIDTQGLLKSALIARAAHGRRHGLDWPSSREPLALFYDSTYRVPWPQAAVERNRALAASALVYAQPQAVRYGISAAPRNYDWLASSRYAVLIHATSANTKLWPEARWTEVGVALHDQGITSVLPWGEGRERERAVRISRGIGGSVVPPRLDLDEGAALLAQAACVVGVDTGLTHLAGALGVPTIGIYTVTDPLRTGLYGCAQAINLGGIGQSPETRQVLRAMEQLR